MTYSLTDSQKITQFVKEGVDLVTRAVEEDEKWNYEEALRLYENGLQCFRNAIEYEATSEHLKQSIQNKSVAYLERVEKIKGYFMKIQEEERKAELYASYAVLVRRLTETGEHERLKEFVFTRVAECGWKKELKDNSEEKGEVLDAIDYIGEEIMPGVLELIPDSIKCELQQKIQAFAEEQNICLPHWHHHI